MLKRIGKEIDLSGAMTTIRDATFPSPFQSELEYSCSARGTWNIVHTGFLVPESHEIFVCAAGCLRGVVLTAAECGLSGRFSTIEIREENVLNGDLEELLINGVSDIIRQLPERPKAILIYTSCIHHFIGCDTTLCYKKLREHYPDIDFTDCYMNPIMRKSGLTPDQIMRRQLYSLWHQPESGQNPRKMNIIGNNLPTQKNSELYTLAGIAGYDLTEIHDCKNYAQYQDMACASANLCYNPVAKAAGEMLAEKYHQKLLYFPVSYSYQEIQKSLAEYANFLNIPLPDYADVIAKCDLKAESLKKLIADTPIMIDYTATIRPLSLARFLLEHHFNVTRIYADGFTQEEFQDFNWLQENYPDLEIFATIQVKMRMIPREYSKKTLAIGQKAAYFLNTPYFINIIENNGFWGFSGILEFLELLEDAFLHEKDTKKLVQIKGVGCGTACI
ncbi:MAG: nitrogenase component 1 [Oscillospiraceae bacterium]|nr:nitrogenase component 1 [Oscillospiraceae bacterium]